MIGAGAVGGYYGARLAQSGLDVRFLLRSDYEIVRTRGLEIRSIDGDFRLEPVPRRFCGSVADMPTCDLVLVALKTTENHRFDELIRPLLHENTAILTLQNGLGNEDALAKLFGRQRVLGGMAFVCINRISPGIVHHMDHGFIRLGEFFGPSDSPRARQIAALFTAAKVPCEALASLMYGRWAKLIWNIPFNGLCALLDLPTDRLIATEEGTAVIRQIMDEVMAAAASDGVQLDAKLPQTNIDLTRTMGAYMPSMQLDRRAGRPMEVEAIFGRPLERAMAHNLRVPHMQMLHLALSLLNSRQR